MQSRGQSGRPALQRGDRSLAGAAGAGRALQQLPARPAHDAAPVAARSGEAVQADGVLNSGRVQYAVILATIAAAAFFIVIYATRCGIATSSDSARYIRSARHVLGREAEAPPPVEAPAEQAHYPPPSSSVLARISLGGTDAPVAARCAPAPPMAAD